MCTRAEIINQASLREVGGDSGCRLATTLIQHGLGED